MTDHDPLLDDLLSAHLDGEATTDDAERIAGDPALQRRLAELAAARDAVRQGVTPVDDTTRDAMLAEVFTTLASQDRRDAEPARVLPLRSRRLDPSRILAAAAAIVAVVLLGGAVVMLAGESDRSNDSASSSPEAATTAAEAAGSDSTTAADGSPASQESSAGQKPTTDKESTASQESTADRAGRVPSLRPGAEMHAVAADDLGTFTDAEALRHALDEVLSDPPVPPALPEPAAGGTSFAGRSCTVPDGATGVYTAVLADEPVFVVVGADGAAAVTQDTCTEVLRVTPQ